MSCYIMNNRLMPTKPISAITANASHRRLGFAPGVKLPNLRWRRDRAAAGPERLLNVLLNGSHPYGARPLRSGRIDRPCSRQGGS